MTRYELLKNNDNLIFQFVKNGILSSQIIRDMEIYQRYNELDEITFNQLKYHFLSEEYEVSEKTIERVIYQMNRTIT